jgi:hypothetical protein
VSEEAWLIWKKGSRVSPFRVILLDLKMPKVNDWSFEGVEKPCSFKTIQSWYRPQLPKQRM